MVNEIKECPDFNLLDAFNEVDWTSSGKISKKYLLTFLSSNNASHSESILDSIIHKIGAEKGFISISDFCSIFNSCSPDDRDY